MNAVDSRYSVDVVVVGETSMRVEVQRMHRRPNDERRMRLVGVRIAAPHAPAVSIRLGPANVRRLIAALEQAAGDAFYAKDDAPDAPADVQTPPREETRPRTRRTT